MHAYSFWSITSPLKLFILSVLLLYWNPRVELNEAGLLLGICVMVVGLLKTSYVIAFDVKYGLLVFLLKGYTFVEHYAGCGVMTDTIRDTKTGFGPAVKLDYEYSKGMDVLTSGGFATHIVSILRGSEDGFVNWQGIPVQLLDVLFQLQNAKENIFVEQLQVCAMESGQPVLRNAWSASTLLAGINSMNQDCLKTIKEELPDDPAELAKLNQAKMSAPAPEVNRDLSKEFEEACGDQSEFSLRHGGGDTLWSPSEKNRKMQALMDVVQRQHHEIAELKKSAVTPTAPESTQAATPAEHDASKLQERPGTVLQQPDGQEQLEPQNIEPAVMHVGTMSRAERERVKRIVTPKPTTGRLEVPQDVFELWQTPKGKEKLLSMWCKSGGVKDCGRLTVEKLDAIIGEIDREYEILAEIQAEGNTTGQPVQLSDSVKHIAKMYAKGCEFPGEGTFCTLRVEGSKAAVEEVMDADHVFVSNDANLIVNAGAGDKLCFTSANLKNCKACFEVYPSRHYFSLQAVVPLLPEPLATRLPEVMHLLRDVHAITEQPGSKVNMQARMGVFLFYRIAESLLSQPFTTESFQDRKKGRDYQTQFSTQLKDEVVQTMKSFLERDGFKFQSVRAEKDISVIHPMVDGGARYKVTTTDSGDMRICQTNGLLPCRDPSHIGKHSRIDVCIVGDLDFFSMSLL
eukprot:s550_g6.t1